MDKSCSEFQQTRAEDRKLKSNLEWLKVEELLPMAEQYEKANFTYWLSEERRRAKQNYNFL